MKIPIKNNSKHKLPQYETENSAGMDLRAKNKTMKGIKILDIEEDYLAYEKDGDIKYVDFEIEYFRPVKDVNEKGSIIIKEPKSVKILSFTENNTDEEVEISDEFKKELEKLIWKNIDAVECSQEELELLEDIKNKRYLYEI